MSITLSSDYLSDVSLGNYTVGSAATDTLTVARWDNLVSSFEPKLKADGLYVNGSFVSGGEWGAAYLVADLILKNKQVSGNGQVKKEAWGNDYSYELRDTKFSDDFFLTKYTELVESLNQDELGISEEAIEGVERDDANIWFTSLDSNPIPDPTDSSRNELVWRDN